MVLGPIHGLQGVRTEVERRVRRAARERFKIGPPRHGGEVPTHDEGGGDHHGGYSGNPAPIPEDGGRSPVQSPEIGSRPTDECRRREGRRHEARVFVDPKRDVVEGSDDEREGDEDPGGRDDSVRNDERVLAARDVAPDCEDRKEKQPEYRGREPPDLERAERPAQARSGWTRRTLLRCEEVPDDRLEGLLVAEEDRVAHRDDVEGEESDEVRDEDLEPREGQRRTITAADEDDAEGRKPDGEYIRREVMGHHDPARDKEKQKLRPTLGRAIGGFGEHDEREERESEEDRPESLLDRLVEQDRRRAEVEQDPHDRRSRTEDPTADRVDRRGERQEPEDRFDPEVPDVRRDRSAEDHVADEDVADRIERVCPRERITRPGEPEPRVQDVFREREVENRVRRVDD